MKKPHRRNALASTVLTGAVAAGAVVATDWCLHAWAFSPYGYEILFDLSLLLNTSTVLPSLFAIPLSLVMIWFPRRRALARIVLPGTVTFLILFLVLWYPAVLPNVTYMRKAAMQRAISNAEPVLVAVESFIADHQRAPDSLEELIPEYLEAIPETGVGAWAEYVYLAPTESAPWSIYLPTPTSIVDFTGVSYRPDGAYPEYLPRLESDSGRVWAEDWD